MACSKSYNRKCSSHAAKKYLLPVFGRKLTVKAIQVTPSIMGVESNNVLHKTIVKMMSFYIFKHSYYIQS